MPRQAEPPALTGVSAALQALGESAASVEDDLLSCLVVMGEPDAQQAVDGWVDQVVDLLRAVDEVTGHHRATLSRVAVRGVRHDADTEHGATLPADHR